jgi:4-carboxymuconolactone decarboxylase
MGIKRTCRSVRINRRHFLKDLSGKALTLVAFYYSLHWAKQKLIIGAGTMNKEPSGAQKLMGDVAPKLADLTDNVLFGDVWEHKGLSKRDRSLATVSALIAMNRPEQLRFHLQRAVDNGVKKEELIEVITQLAFYSGWPNAVTAITVFKEVFPKYKAS